MHRLLCAPALRTFFALVAAPVAMTGCMANTAPGETQGADEAAANTSSAKPLFDLTGFQLQLPTGPTGHPDTVNGSALAKTSNPYFYIDSAGAVNFMDPRTGTTTGGSKHPRSEMREVTSGWKATGTNTLTASVAVVTVPSTVTIGQIFQAPNAPSKPLAELEYHKGGKVTLFLELSNQGGGAFQTYDVGQVTDGAEFYYQLSLTGNTIKVTVNSKVTSIPVPSSFSGEAFYFKCGAYDQTAVAGTAAKTVGTHVKFYDATIVHKT